MFLPVLAAVALLAGAAPLAPAPTSAGSLATAETPLTLEVSSPATAWRAQAEDNIVGLRDPKKLSNPSLVDYPTLMAATAEMKRIKREGIDESSPEGIQLKNRAASKVATACETVMNAQGHCSVWKTISHEDGRTITDLTTKVKRRL